jgi:undecaprenyl-diphosphatase
MTEQIRSPRSSRERPTIAGRLFHDRLGANASATRAALRRPRRARNEVRPAPWLLLIAASAVAILLTAILLDARSPAWAAALSDGLATVFRRITVAGKSDWYLVPTGVVLIVLALGAWGKVDQQLRAAWAEIAALIGYAFVSVAAAVIAVNLLKQIIGRSRPARIEEDGWFAFDAFNFDYANASFPSGHATTAGAALMVGALIFPRFRVPIVAAGLLIAFSRVIVGAHYPSDAVAGVALGAGIAYFVARYLLRRGVAFRVDEFGRVRPRSGAACAARRRSWARLLAAPLAALAGRSRAG